MEADTLKKYYFICFCTVSFIILLIVFCLTSCGYNESWIVGKTSEQVIERYGDFESYTATIGEDGLYRSGACFYKLKPARKGYFGTDYGTHLCIWFDENGIATKCYDELSDIGG